jgi:hypothetical protein
MGLLENQFWTWSIYFEAIAINLRGSLPFLTLLFGSLRKIKPEVA